MKVPRTIKNEEGQAIIMVTVLVIVWIALIGVVVDIGNAYAQRRHAQNSADAAAIAATGELARGENTTNHRVLAKAKEYAQHNNIDPNTVVANYFRFDPDTQAMTSLGAVPDNTGLPPANANGVDVTLGKTFPTYLVQVLGRTELSAGAESAGQFTRGACIAGDTGTGLFPIAVAKSLFHNDRDEDEVAYGETYRIWGDKTSPGNFHWISWNDDSGHTSEGTLVQNMANTGQSGRWSVGSHVYAGPGVKDSSSVKAELDVRIADTNPLKPARVLLPVYDTFDGTGENVRYHVIGFAWFRLTEYDFRGNDRYVDGVFEEGMIPASEGGCLDFGTSVIKLRPPMDLTRAIEGRLAFERLVVDQPPQQTNYPVDVVLVMDTSGSMNETWGGEPKIETARDVLREFSTMLRPEIGDRVALLHFPRVTTLDGSSGYETFGSQYRTTCGNQRSSYRFRAERLVELTSNMQAITDTVRTMGANGGTPIAGAMQEAFAMVTGPFHDPAHAKIVILASDGMTNVTLNERWTGYSGNTTSGMGGCNGLAEAQSVDVAAEAKQAGVTVFTIAIGDDFSAALLSAMASPDSDPSRPHFYQANNPTAMRQIYDALGQRIINYGGECTIKPVETAGAGATVRIFKNGTLYAETTASASGSFVFPNVEPGAYTFSATVTRDGLTYDVFTNRIGGTEIAAPTITVGEDAGIYSADLSLKTAHPPVCGA